MRKFSCPTCETRIFFENFHCGTCKTDLAFDPRSMRPEALADNRLACGNRSHMACNWCVSAGDGGSLCIACRLNRMIPALNVGDNAWLWAKIELAKHRLVYDLLRLGLPIVDKLTDPVRGLCFDFLSDQPGQKVLTGHADGVVTINIAEADDAEREARRIAMHEPYRTLLGHFRHEVGHYYWDLFVRDTRNLGAFRAIFGDERDDYMAALQRHYQNPVMDWQDQFVSVYASSHAWEDWAESFAHFLHIVATLDTAAVLPLALSARIWKTLGNPYREEDFHALVNAWLPLAESLNELNRSMGLVDPYPFVLTPAVIGKLHLVHMIVSAATRGSQVDVAALDESPPQVETAREQTAVSAA